MKTSILLLGILGLVSPVFAADSDMPNGSGNHFKIIQTTSAVFPLSMIQAGVSQGQAKVVLHVDAQGKLVELLTIAYTRRAFAEEAERVIKQWKFEPENADGVGVDTITTITLNFEHNGLMVVSRYAGLMPTYFDFAGGFEYEACSMKNLDRIPTPVNVVAPAYYKELADKGIVGKVVVDFYIDETGKTRFVATSPGTNELLADIAVTAVQKWQFTPPTRHGKPALVHAHQSFDFHPENALANQ